MAELLVLPACRGKRVAPWRGTFFCNPRDACVI
jgi:hypothetical protein